MFIIAAGDSCLEAALARLARLMINIERGERVYEWGPGSSAAPNASPAGNFLALQVPSLTAGAPPTTAVYRPSVGVVYHLPGLAGGAQALAEALEALLAREGDAHLRGYLTVEAAPHASLLHRGSVHSAAPGGAATPRLECPVRTVQASMGPQQMEHRGHGAALPHHYSVLGAFTWYILPASTLAEIQTVETLAAFNALVASVLLDTGLAPAQEPAAPILDDTSGYFRVAPLPPAVRDSFAGDPPPACDLTLIYTGSPVWGRFEIAGPAIAAHLGRWRPPPGGEPPADLAELASPDVCSYCEAPLWGVFYAVAHPGFAPHRAPLCRWCFGCFPAWVTAGGARACHPRGLVEACAGTAGWELLVGVLGTPVRRVAEGGRAYVVDAPGGGAGWILVPAPPRDVGPFVCLADPGLAAHRVRAVGHEKVAEALMAGT